MERTDLPGDIPVADAAAIPAEFDQASLPAEGAPPPTRRRRLRIALLVGGIAVLLVLLVVGGAYAWLAVSLSKANNRPGVAEARQALQATITSSAPAQKTPTTAPLVPGTSVPPPDDPDTMNILLLGADKVSWQPETYGRSDTMMIMHIDPTENFVSILSLPRDLRIELGEHGYQKLNAAYAFGGDALAITTIRELTGLPIDHYVKVGFEAFTSLTTQLGGVWIDVDRRYYYNQDVYEPINLQPGYQRIAGLDALQYVRFRHDLDHDWARIQRQQRFLRAAKEQVFQWDMATRIPAAVTTLMKNVATEIGPADALKLVWWMAHLDMSRVKQVAMQGTDQMIDGAAYVVSTDEEIGTAVTELMTPPADAASSPSSTTTVTATSGPRDSTPSLSGISVEVRYAAGKEAEASAAARWLEAHGAGLRDVSQTDGGSGLSQVSYPAENDYTLVPEGRRVALAMGIHAVAEDNDLRHVVVLVGSDFQVPDPAATVATLEASEWRYLAEKALLPVQSPAFIPGGFDFVGSRVYDIQTDDGPRPALKVNYRLGREDQYLGIMETTFVDAPAASAGEQVTQSGVTYTIVDVGGQVERVWWKRDGVLYWVSNTLASILSREQLLEVATSMSPLY